MSFVLVLSCLCWGVGSCSPRRSCEGASHHDLGTRDVKPYTPLFRLASCGSSLNLKCKTTVFQHNIKYSPTRASLDRSHYLFLFFGPLALLLALPALPPPNPRPFGTARRCFPVVNDVVSIALFFKTSRM